MLLCLINWALSALSAVVIRWIIGTVETAAGFGAVSKYSNDIIATENINIAIENCNLEWGFPLKKVI